MKQTLDMAAAFGDNGTQAEAAPLDEYRVDLDGLIEQGIPEPAFVPGCQGFLRAGKRHLIPRRPAPENHSRGCGSRSKLPAAAAK